MIHEAMILDHSGIDLTLYQYTASLKLMIYSTLAALLLNPFGVLGRSRVCRLWRDAPRAGCRTRLDRNAHGTLPHGSRPVISALCHRNRGAEHPHFHLLAPAMINALTILFCLTLIYLAVTTRLSAYVLILVLQGILVGRRLCARVLP